MQIWNYSNVIQVDPTGITANSVLTLAVTMNISSSLRSSKSVYVWINPSMIRVNLVPLGMSMIRSGSEHGLPLNPGLYSFDLDWSRRDPSCLSNRTGSEERPLRSGRFEVNGSFSVSLRYDGVSSLLKSALVILDGSFLSSRRSRQLSSCCQYLDFKLRHSTVSISPID